MVEIRGITCDSVVNQIATCFHYVRRTKGALHRIAFEKAATVSCKKEEVAVITQETLTDFIRRSMPDAMVTMIDRTGTMDHLKVVVVSDTFQGKNLLDRHRLIYQALDIPLKDGRIHALELTAKTKDEN